MTQSEKEPVDDRSRHRYYAADGLSWRVSERNDSGREPALYFESERMFRRVTHYPSDWRDLTSAELEILSHRS